MDKITLQLEIDEEYMRTDEEDIFKVTLTHPRLHGSLHFYYKESDPSVKNQILRDLDKSSNKDLQNLGESFRELKSSFMKLF